MLCYQGVDRLNRILQSLFRTVFAGETLNEFQTANTDFFNDMFVSYDSRSVPDTNFFTEASF